MAGAGARKRLDENRARLRLLAAMIATGMVTFLTVRLTLFRQITHIEHWLGFALTVIVEGLTFAAISMAAQAVYDGSGRLLDGGADLNKGAVSSYADVLYLSVLVQLVAAFTNYGWWVGQLDVNKEVVLLAGSGAPGQPVAVAGAGPRKVRVSHGARCRGTGHGAWPAPVPALPQCPCGAPEYYARMLVVCSGTLCAQPPRARCAPGGRTNHLCGWRPVRCVRCRPPRPHLCLLLPLPATG